MISPHAERLIGALPKAELHVHLEGSIAPQTAVELAARHGISLTPDEVVRRYAFRDFRGFLEAFKWVTSFLRSPADYSLAAESLFDQMFAQNIIYAEITLSAGVMLLRKQDVEAIFAALRETARRAHQRGLSVQWILDAVRQFGPEAAMEVARLGAQMRSEGVVAFGLGGDELALPASAFRAVYEYVAEQGLHRLVHAGETGGPQAVRDAVEILGAERIGHGIAAMHDPDVVDLLAASGTNLEICPTSNLKTGALADQLGRTDVTIQDHPMWRFLKQGPLFTISTDDPAMFETSLNKEYELLLAQGHSLDVATQMAVRAATASFLPPQEKTALARRIQDAAEGLGLV